MATRYLTQFTGSATTWIGLPSYTGELTFDLYTRVDSQTVAGETGFTLHEWNTVTANVSDMTEIGRSFNGIIANISGTGLDIPVALASGIESPATLNGSGFSQFEVEEVNPPYNDWARTLNLFTPGQVILEVGGSGFPHIINNLPSGNRRFYVDAVFEAVDGSGVPTGAAIPLNSVGYKVGSTGAETFDNGVYGIGEEFYKSSNSNLHYVQVDGNQVRTRLTARTSEVFEYPRPDKDILYAFGNGQSLSVGDTSGLTDLDHTLPIGNGSQQLTYGNRRPLVKGGSSYTYQNIRPWVEERSRSTHCYAMLSQLDSLDFPSDAVTLLTNEGVQGQNIDGAASYGPTNVSTALTQFKTNENFPASNERAIFIWNHGESNDGNFPLYKTKLRTLHDNYISAADAVVSGIDMPMILDQPGSSDVYWGIANALFEYARDNSDGHFVTPKYHINGRYPANPGVDWVHLNKFGYDLMGEYFGRAINDVIYGGGSTQWCGPISAYPEGNTVVITMNVPSPPLVKDAVTIQQTTADGIAYRIAGGGTITPLSQAIDGNKIIIDIGQAPQIGDSVEFGNNSNVVPGIGTSLPIVNIRDSSSDVGTITGEPLYNWVALSSVEITEPPIDILQGGQLLQVESPAHTFQINSFDVVQSVSGVSVESPQHNFAINEAQIEFTQSAALASASSPAQSFSFGQPPIEFTQGISSAELLTPRHAIIVGEAVRISTFTVTWA